MGLTSKNLISRIQRSRHFSKDALPFPRKISLDYICFRVTHQKATVFLFQGNLMFPIMFIDKGFLWIQVTVLIKENRTK